MQNIEVRTGNAQARTSKFYLAVFALVILIATAALVFGLQRFQPAAPTRTAITARALEEQYGLRVNLVAVTGAGGFVDVRLKIVNAERAKLLLADKNNFPSVMVNDDVVLNAPEDTKSQEIRFENDGNMFILYANSGNAVRPGAQVRILFGETALDPIIVR